MSLVQLRVLAAVARHESVTEAAKELHYSQPSVSHHLSRLEAATGVQLVQRVGRGVRMTARGWLLADRATEILRQVDKATSDLTAEPGSPVRESGLARTSSVERVPPNTMHSGGSTSWAGEPDDVAGRGLDLHVELGGRGVRATLERELREAVRCGRLKPGTRLPSSRALAADLGIARNTVANAYAQLVGEGWLEAQQGRGTSVAHDLPKPATSAEPVAHDPRPRYDLRPGVPDVADFPRDAWARAYRRALLATPAEELAYGDPQGHPRLRKVLAAYLGRARGVNTTADQIVICNGATHGLSMLATVLVKIGRGTLAMESHCFPAYYRVAMSHGLTVAALPLDDDGARVEALAHTRAAAAVLTPAHQFPTGVPLSTPRRADVLEWARATDGLVVEDDYDGEFRFDEARIGALQASDPERVVYLGSLSKPMAPGLRLGWMAVPRELVAPLLRVRRDTDLHPAVGEQLALADYIECGDFDRHLRAARLRYRRRREQLERALVTRRQPLQVRGARAGLHLVVKLPGGHQQEMEVVRRASAVGLALVGLSRFRISEPQNPQLGGLVISYARPPAHAFRGALDTLLDVL